MIKKYYVSGPGLVFDRREKKYFSWGYDIYINGVRHQERGFTSKELAEKAAAKLKEDAKLSLHGIKKFAESPTLIELFQVKLDTMTRTKKDRVRAKIVFNKFLSMLPPGIKVTELRTAHLQKYVTTRLSEISERSNEPILPQTVNRELAPIVAALNMAATYFEELDQFVPPKTPRAKEPNGRKERVISKTEQKQILDYLFADRKDNEDRRAYENRIRTGEFLLFCLLTLSRPGEAAKLLKSDVDLEQGIVTVTSWKTRFTASKITRLLKITPKLRAILKRRLSVSSSPYVFTSGGKVTPKMYQQMRKACEAYGIRYGREDKTAISFHTARHTGITRLLQNGVDLKTIGKIAGHSDAKMTLYYSHSNTDLTDKASDILDAEI